MKISVKVKTKSKQEKVVKIDDKNFEVAISALPVDGKANKAVIKVLAKYFKTSLSKIEIKSGLSSKNKIIEIR